MHIGHTIHYNFKPRAKSLLHSAIHITLEDQSSSAIHQSKHGNQSYA